MSALHSAAEALLDATRDLARALESGDAEALDVAMAARERAFEALGAASGGPVPEPVRALLREVSEIDRSALASAEAQRESTRHQLHELRRARNAVRSLGPETEPPRFLSRRA